MLFHLGEDRSLRLDRLTALLDFGLFLRNPGNREFLQLAGSEGRLEGVPSGLSPETLVLAGRQVRLSAISRQTLAARAARTLPGGWAPERPS